jgi:uncharacterized protein (TIGR02246 family)
MKLRSLLAFTGLVISLAVPSIAQEQNTVDPEVRQQIEATLTKFGEAYNKHDAAAIAALFTPDAVEVWYSEAASGQQAIEKRYAVDAASGNSIVGNLVQVYSIGNDICAIWEFSLSTWKGHAVTIYVRDADTWKIRMKYSN